MHFSRLLCGALTYILGAAKLYIYCVILLLRVRNLIRCQTRLLSSRSVLFLDHLFSLLYY